MATPKKTSKTKPKAIKTQRKNIRVVPLRAGVVEQLPDSPLTKKGLTLRKLLSNTPRFRREVGKDEVTLLKLKKATTASGLPAIKALARHKDPFMPNKTVKDREVFIIGLDSQTKPVSKQKRVMVSCECEDFCFHGGEYSCALHGAARIIYGNGQPPTFTNPGNVPFLCKHLSALAYRVIERGL